MIYSTAAQHRRDLRGKRRERERQRKGGREAADDTNEGER